MRQWKKRAGAMLLSMAMVLGPAAVAAGAEKTITVTPMGLNINGQKSPHRRGLRWGDFWPSFYCQTKSSGK